MSKFCSFKLFSPKRWAKATTAEVGFSILSFGLIGDGVEVDSVALTLMRKERVKAGAQTNRKKRRGLISNGSCAPDENILRNGVH